MRRFEVLFRETVYRGWANVDELCVRHESNGGQWREPEKRLSVEAGDAAAVLLHNTDDDTILLVRQFRAPLIRHGEPWNLEIVAGKVDKGETPEQAARREVLEEVGHRLNDLQPITEMYPSSGILSEKVTLFFATIDSTTKVESGGGDESEDLELVSLPLQEALTQAQTAQLKDAKTLITLLWLATQ
jgi:ADP-ribose pyrophosphatase